MLRQRRQPAESGEADPVRRWRAWERVTGRGIAEAEVWVATVLWRGRGSAVWVTATQNRGVGGGGTGTTLAGGPGGPAGAPAGGVEKTEEGNATNGTMPNISASIQNNLPDKRTSVCRVKLRIKSGEKSAVAKRIERLVDVQGNKSRRPSCIKTMDGVVMANN